jgi:hypothetical protein
MTPSVRLDLAEAARANVARTLALLERPNVAALHRVAAELTEAIARMELLQGAVEGKGIVCHSKSVIVALRKDLRRAGRLLRHAWELRLGPDGEQGYTEKGEQVQQAASTVRWVLKA